MTASFNESVVEEAALAWLAGLGYAVACGPGRLRDALVFRGASTPYHKSRA